MRFEALATKANVTDDTAPTGDGPSGRVLSLPAYHDEQRKRPTGSVVAFFEVLDASDAAVAAGTVDAQLWLRDEASGKWTKVDTKKTGVGNDVATEFKWAGSNAPGRAFLQLTGIAGVGAAKVKVYAAPSGVRS